MLTIGIVVNMAPSTNKQAARAAARAHIARKHGAQNIYPSRH